MAHLIIIREATSFVQGEHHEIGAHERVEEAINQRKYPLKGLREGYNIPFQTEFKFVQYRIKKECIPEFVRDMRCIVLNPKDNKMSIWKMIKNNERSNGTATLNKGMMMVLWGFKWFNKFPIIYPAIKGYNSFKWTANIPLLKKLKDKQIKIIILKKITPSGLCGLKPVSVAPGEANPFSDNWNYNFCIGYFEDIDNGWGEEL